jgi:hypothetical protein
MSTLLLVRPLVQKTRPCLLNAMFLLRVRALPIWPHGVQGTVVVPSYGELLAYHKPSHYKYYTVIFGVSRGAWYLFPTRSTRKLTLAHVALGALTQLVWARGRLCRPVKLEV